MSKTVLTFIADTHHYSKTLGASGETYMLRSDSDQKCLAETGEIIDSAFEKIGNSDCDAVMIVGDLSNDGERVCHEEFREKLYKLKNKKKVYVITATHDWCCDRNPRRFEGDKVCNDVPTVDHNELSDFYYDFGVSDARAEYKTTLGPASYAVDIGENVTLLALNDDKNGRGGAGFKKAHLEWILEQIKDAVSRGRVPVAMEHHLLYRHISPIITKHASVGDGERILNEMADAGLRFVFVGHSHMQRIDKHTSPAGNTIYEINVGSLVGYPAPIVTMTVEDGGISVDTEHLKECTFDGEKIDLTKFLADHATRIISVVFDAAASGDREQLTKRLGALNIKRETIDKYYFIAAPVLRGISSMTVGKAGKILNTVTLGKAIPQESVNALSNTKVMDIMGKVFLSLLDGSLQKYSPKDDFYKVVRGTLGLPLRVCRTFRVNGKAYQISFELDRAAEELLTGGELDNNRLYIER